MQLKKFIMAGALTGIAAAICMADASVPDLKKFKDQTRSSCSSGTIVEGFDGKPTGWKLPKGAIIEKHAGRNGTAALLYQRTNPKVYGMTVSSRTPETETSEACVLNTPKTANGMAERIPRTAETARNGVN
jgi:hypothetical protein